MMYEIGEYLLRATAIWSVLLLYYLVWGQGAGFRFQRLFLLGSWCFGLLVPLLPAPATTTIGEVQLNLPALSLSKTIGAAGGTAPAVGESVSWATILLAVYLIGLFFVWARSLVRTHRIRQRAGEYTGERYAGYPVIRSRRIGTPFAAAGRIFLPARLADEALTATALLHESAHLRLRHPLDKFILTATGHLLWFHPLARVWRRLLATVHEYEADAAVVQTVPRAAYGLQLLYAAQGPARPMGLFSSSLKKRIHMLTQTTRRRLRPLPLALLLFLVAGLIVACSDVDTPLLDAPPASGGENTIARYGDAADDNASMEDLLRAVYTEIRYPAEARNDGLVGKYRALVQLDEMGQVTDIKVRPFTHELAGGPPAHPEVTITGYASAPGDGTADPSVLMSEIERTLLTLENFRPATRDGKAVPSRLNLDFNFILE